MKKSVSIIYYFKSEIVLVLLKIRMYFKTLNRSFSIQELDLLNELNLWI